MRIAARIFTGRQPLTGVAVALLASGLAYTARADPPDIQRPESASDSTAEDAAPKTIIETPDTRIGNITITRKNIFDLDDPREDKSIYRLVNKLHIKTRKHVIDQQLLFGEGDVYSLRTLEESERILRSNRYIQDAKVEPTQREDGVVDVNVTTSDTWTLGPRAHISRAGGENSSSAGFRESNLLGTGISLELARRSDVDRDTNLIKIRDTHLGDSWYDLSALFSQNSDGHTRNFAVEKPFYSLDSTNANGIRYLDDDRIDSVYDHGEIVAQYRHHKKSDSAYYGWSKGLRNDLARRFTVGIAYQENLFSAFDGALGTESVLPEDRKLVYPFVGLELVEDKFKKTKNRDDVQRVEDRFIGARIGARLGLARKALASDRDAWLLDVFAQNTYDVAPKRSWTVSSALATRVERDGIQNLTLDMRARYDIRQSEKWLFYANLSGTYGHNLDADNQLLLGGDTGLRGYPLRYQTGDKKILLTLEQRFFTDWYPFRLFRVGAAVFFDSGRTWGDGSVASQNEGVLNDIGIGLRLGTPRSGLGRVIHIDFAYALDGDPSISKFQILIESRTSF